MNSDEYWSPLFDEIIKIKKRMNEVWKKLGEPLEEEFGSFPIDISETSDEVIVRADLPGFEKEDISIKATENTLEISAQHKEVKKKETENLYKAERRFGSVKRAFSLPIAVDPKVASAEFINGVLTIRLAKKEKKKFENEIKIK